MNTTRFMGITTTILSVTLMALFVQPSVDFSQDVFAEKAEGSPGSVSPKSYGSSTEDIVCGDRLCSTPEGSPEPGNIGRAQ